jgi:hypothetical protein
MAFEYTKQPWEEEIIGIDFSRRIPAGTTVLAVQTGVTEAVLEAIISPQGLNPNDYGSHLVVSTAILTGITGKEKILTSLVSGGVTGFKYRVAFKVTLSDGQKKEDDVLVIVKET